MFDKEFYPTPESTLDVMGIDCANKIVLEPQSGKGNIVDYVKKWGAKEVYAIEKVPELRQIVSAKAKVIGSDFFDCKAEEISHIDLIVMNPPFSNADKHILHAWNIAPEGCEIISLCNYETIEKSHYGSGRRELQSIISDYGESMNIGDAFSDAERKTGIDIGLIRLFKPMLTDNGQFDDFYMDADEEIGSNAIIAHNELKAVVNTYMAAVKTFDKVEALAKELNIFTDVEFIGQQKEDGTYEKHRLQYGIGLAFNASREDQIIDKATFAKGYQMKCWQFIFNRVKIDKYVTAGVMKDINLFIQNRKNYPFTVKNISKMLDIIVGTRDNIMSKAIVEAVDNFTRHTHDNRFGVEGWKTNSGYLLNKKFIINYLYDSYYGHTTRNQNLLDLVKAICYLTGTDYENVPQMPYKMTTNKWYEWGFFEFKVFKKGTGHFKFKDENVWSTLNIAYAKIKGQVLPEKI